MIPSGASLLRIRVLVPGTGARFRCGGLSVALQTARLLDGARPPAVVAPAYGVTVFVHSDRCAKKLLPWMDGMLTASERYYATHGEPLVSSHMIDLSEEPMDENIALCVECAPPPLHGAARPSGSSGRASPSLIST